MPKCHDMKKGEVYYCPVCGLAVQVTHECVETGEPIEAPGMSFTKCSCEPPTAPCMFSCCGKELQHKAA